MEAAPAASEPAAWAAEALAEPELGSDELEAAGGALDRVLLDSVCQQQGWVRVYGKGRRGAVRTVAAGSSRRAQLFPQFFEREVIPARDFGAPRPFRVHLPSLPQLSPARPCPPPPTPRRAARRAVRAAAGLVLCALCSSLLMEVWVFFFSSVRLVASTWAHGPECCDVHNANSLKCNPCY